MKRWHEETAIAKRQWRIHRKFVHDDRPTGCLCDEQMGRFRKHRGLDCGKPRCQLCHFDKIHGIKTRNEQLADLRFREQLSRCD